jgi:hypothetical protein
MPYKKEIAAALHMLKAAHFFAFSLSPVPRLREIRLEPPIPNKFAIPVSMTKGGIAIDLFCLRFQQRNVKCMYAHDNTVKLCMLSGKPAICIRK